MSLFDPHQYEDELRKKLERRDPKNQALKYLYHSTWAAIEAYQKALFLSGGD